MHRYLVRMGVLLHEALPALSVAVSICVLRLGHHCVNVCIEYCI